MTQDESLHIILHSEEWFHEMFLPFARYVNGEKQFGFLVGNGQINFAVLGHHRATLYLDNMFSLDGEEALIPQLEKMNKASYDSFHAMLNDGWEID